MTANSVPLNPFAGFNGPLRGEKKMGKEEEGREKERKKDEETGDSTPHEINVWLWLRLSS